MYLYIYIRYVYLERIVNVYACTCRYVYTNKSVYICYICISHCLWPPVCTALQHIWLGGRTKNGQAMHHAICSRAAKKR